MTNLKYLYVLILSIFLLMTACQDDDGSIGDVIAPSNISITANIVGQDANNPTGDGSGVVNFSTTASDAISYKYVYNGIEKNAPSGETTVSFSTLGVNTYDVIVIVYGIGGISSSETISIDVLATYAPPPELLELLVGDGFKTWRIKSDKQGHFGLGPVGGIIPSEFFGAAPEDKVDVGMYDDRYIFNIDGSFTHITDSTNDDPTEDTSGTVFGREVLINELGTGPGEVDGADIINFPYCDNFGNWTLTAPGGVETLTLSGLGFMGYYIGGNHSYEIFERSNRNEMMIKTTDGNNQFDWWFIMTSE